MDFPERPDLWLPPPAPPRPRKFQHPYRLHILLFLLTLVTTTWAGLIYSGIPMWPLLGFGFSSGFFFWSPEVWPLIPVGFWYALPILTILGAHEFGHYLLCRRHDVDATLPFFIPAPLPLTGTFGAVIKIREMFPSRKVLFDIGVGGPIAGFVALLPFLWWGITMSERIDISGKEGVIWFGEPLLFKAMAWLHFGTLAEGQDIGLHPLGFAAWFGMLATALNLLPFGQLDGGHIAYAVFGRRAVWLSKATLAIVLVLTLFSRSWIVMAVMMVAMALAMGFRHPAILDHETPLDRGRKVIAFLALVMLVLCFTPVPIETFFGP